MSKDVYEWRGDTRPPGTARNYDLIFTESGNLYLYLSNGYYNLSQNTAESRKRTAIRNEGAHWIVGNIQGIGQEILKDLKHHNMVRCKLPRPSGTTPPAPPTSSKTAKVSKTKRDWDSFSEALKSYLEKDWNDIVKQVKDEE